MTRTKSLYIFLSLIILMGCVSSKKETAQNKNYFHDVIPAKMIVTVNYYPETTNIQSVNYDNFDENVVMKFYQNQKLQSVARGKYIDKEKLYDFEKLCGYNFLLWTDDLGGFSSQFFADRYYDSGQRQALLINETAIDSTFKYEIYYRNGTVKQAMRFKHYNLDSLFKPIGIWIEFAENGDTLRSYNAPQTYVVDNWF